MCTGIACSRLKIHTNIEPNPELFTECLAWQNCHWRLQWEFCLSKAYRIRSNGKVQFIDASLVQGQLPILSDVSSHNILFDFLKTNQTKYFIYIPCSLLLSPLLPLTVKMGIALLLILKHYSPVNFFCKGLSWYLFLISKDPRNQKQNHHQGRKKKPNKWPTANSKLCPHQLIIV